MVVVYTAILEVVQGARALDAGVSHSLPMGAEVADD